MSGGTFEYTQYQISQLADQISRELEQDTLVKTDPDKAKDKLGWLPEPLTEETTAKFKEAITTLNKAFIMAHRIDWLIAGDDSQASFNKRWEEDLKELK
jgi:hypothetical protein